MAFQLNNIVLVGIWWTGMSALARLFHQTWFTNIVGINNSNNQMTDELTKLWIEMRFEHGTYDVQPNDVVIYSDIEAIKLTKELQQSFAYESQNLKHHHRPWTYNECIAEISKLFVTVAITWTNGKSSTTWMAIKVTQELLPNFWLWIVWALLVDYDNTNLILSEKQGTRNDIQKLVTQMLTGKLVDSALIKKYLFILEACEHKEHMLMYDYDHLLITNIGYDHQDYYTTQEHYYDAMVKAILQSKKSVVVLKEEKSISKAIQWSSLSQALQKEAMEKTTFVDLRQGKCDRLFGYHRSLNGWLTKGLLKQIATIQEEKIDESLQSFSWLWRRMEFLGKTSWWASVYTDYGHHPAAIKHALSSLKEEFPDKQIVAVIEPHQAQRLLSLWDWFGEVFTVVDKPYMMPVYHARESFDDIKPLADKVFGVGEVQSFTQLHATVATSVGATLVVEERELHQMFNKTSSDDVVIVFSAWLLDAKTRSYFVW